MAKYQVASSIGEGKEFMTGIEFDYVIEDESIGKKVNCLGGQFTIAQNGQILVLTNPDWVLTLLKKEEPKSDKNEEEYTFEVNKDWDMFFETKTFKLHDTPVNNKGITYKEFYEAVKREWDQVKNLRAEELPMEFNEEFNNLTFINDWCWESDDYKYLRNGSWGRKTATGKSF